MAHDKRILGFFTGFLEKGFHNGDDIVRFDVFRALDVASDEFLEGSRIENDDGSIECLIGIGENRCQGLRCDARWEGNS